MGRVYLAHHTVLDRQCALKFMPDELGDRPGWVDRFKTEARMLARLDHPNIVRVHSAAADTEARQYYLEMEYVDGGDLEERVVRSDRGLEEPMCRRVLDEILQALEYAHGLNVIHRDLKPANILLRRDGTVKISDFGLAMVVGEDYHRSLIEKSITLSQLISSETIQATNAPTLNSMGGTLPFMSPQTKKGEPPDKRDDIYAVGVLAYKILSGQLPDIDGAPLRSRRPEISKGWEGFYRKCIASRREDRFQTATEARAALARLAPTGSKRTLWIGAGLAAAVVLIGGGVLWTTRPESLPPIVSGPPRVEQRLDFPAAVSPLYVDQAVNLAARASSGLEVAYEVVAGPGAIEQGTLRFSEAAPVTVRATQPGDARHLPVTAERVFTPLIRAVIQPQHITFAPLPDRKTNDEPFDLGATATSGLPVAFAVVSGPATLDGTRLVLNGVGTVVIRAVQAGDAAFSPALPVERSFAVSPYVPPSITLDLPGEFSMELKLVPAGEIRLGSEAREIGQSTTDSKAEVFVVARSFYMGATEVTQGQYRSIMGMHPSSNRFKGDDHPVEQVRLSDVAGSGGFIEKLNAWFREKGYARYVARLPTEQEWEYACRAGTTSSLNDGTSLAHGVRDPALDRLAVYGANTTAPVGTKRPNAWGLFDMHGNVAEWTAEGHVRGGSFRDNAAACRSAARLRNQGSKVAPDDRFGFRIILQVGE